MSGQISYNLEYAPPRARSVGAPEPARSAGAGSEECLLNIPPFARFGPRLEGVYLVGGVFGQITQITVSPLEIALRKRVLKRQTFRLRRSNLTRSSRD